MNDKHTSYGDTSGHDDAQSNIRDVETFIDVTDFSLNLPKVSTRFIAAGLHRTTRTLQRYCEQGSLDARKYPTSKGVLWMVSPASVDLKIKEIQEIEKATAQISSTTDDTQTPRDMTSSKVSPSSDGNDKATIREHQRQSFDDADTQTKEEAPKEQPTIERHSTTHTDDNYLSIPAGVLDVLTEQLAEKDKQIARRDDELKRMGEERALDHVLLKQAFQVIHGDDFTPALAHSAEGERQPQKPHLEIKPEPLNQHQAREGDKPPPPSANFSV